jgi:hypothetical protein
MASFHAEAEHIEDQYFRRLELLRKLGHSVIFRFVGHPSRLQRMSELSARCRDIDVTFHSTPLFSPAYPSRYTIEERALLEKSAVSLSQLIQLRGGVDTSTTRCHAGSRLFAIDMRTGNIVPCVSVQGPVIGNIYRNELQVFGSTIPCPARGIACLCDIHFQQDIVEGASDSALFEQEKRGYVNPHRSEEVLSRIRSIDVTFSVATPGIGQTSTADLVSLSTEEVKSAFDRNKTFLLGDYAAGNHPFFKWRQFALPTEPQALKPGAAAASRGNDDQPAQTKAGWRSLYTLLTTMWNAGR